MKHRYFIVTRGRAHKQTTIENLPEEILKKTILVCDRDQYKDHRERYKDICKVAAFPKNFGKHLTKKIGCVSDKKQWIVDTYEDVDFVYFLDDDLRFYVRKEKGGIKLSQQKNKDKLKMFKTMKNWLEKDGLAHVGISTQEGNNREKENYVENGRCIRLVGFNRSILVKEKIELNATQMMGDFHTTLSLLEMGYPNRISYFFAQAHRKSNDDGGCSLYRTPLTLKESAILLKEYHSSFVKLEVKKTKKPWAGFDTKERVDVTVYWKKAFKFGGNKKKMNKWLKK